MKYSILFSVLMSALCFTACQKEISWDTGTTPNIPVDTTGNGTDTTGNGTDTTVNTNPGTENATYYYSAVIDGKQYSAKVTDDNGYEAGSGLSGVDDVVFGASVALIDYAVGPTGMGISKGIMHGYYNATDAEFRGFFLPGNYPYAPEGHDGVEIGWQDENGTYWTTGKGTADQTGSSFKITAQKDAQTIIDLYIQVTCEFNCKLYDDEGHVKTLTNGKFVGLFGKI